MQIKDMFVKPIDRDIQGVIIVGQGEETNRAQELEEYVVTRELQKHFADFFAAYKKGIVGETPKMGVWISGFFGSGKSHFLKILSYLLDSSMMVNGRKPIDYFTIDAKITDAMVLADIKLAADTPTDVVLFNIDSKSDSTSKQNKDAIVNVFLKVFNEMQGFCGSMPHLADLERRLVTEGRYDEFREKFEEEYGEAWESSRQDFDFIQDTVVEVLDVMGFMSESAARNWCEKAAEPYAISIEDFAKRVNEYIKRKGNNHHVVFLVDEIGQYIGEDSNLMLNLQTVTEDLGRECKGKAWVIVTSQQDIDSVTKVKGNDFSKIQGRFDTRLALSSANVDEVIKERILRKNETAKESLSLLYEQKATIIKNLIVFNDQVEKKLYGNGADFTAVYPFVPYQFNLLASVLTSIRTHGASGKHLSEGERSMLALFKESAANMKESEMGAIIPFHRFYDALENFLDHSHRGVIIRAYDNTVINPEKGTDVFAINVLKTLFMIKYVNEVEANLENITSLMISDIDDDRIALKDKVDDALRILCRQMLVQKNGDLYVFLTDEEQEINREIDSQNVEMAEVINKVSEMIFEDIFSDKKYRYPQFNGRYSFGFNQVVDDRPYKSNQSYDVGLRILTPWYEGGNDDATLRLMSGQGREVIVMLPNDAAFLEEIRVYLKIEKFLRLGTSTQLTKYETIKEGKRVEMRERHANAKLYLIENLKDATIYVNGDIAKLQSKEVVGRMTDAIGRLVQTVYHKLTYIEAACGEAEIRKLFAKTGQMALDLGSQAEVNVHALEDMLSYITMNSQNHMKTSMKTLKDRFMKAPYGYVEDDVHYLAARLFHRGDLSLSVSGEAVTLMNKSTEDIIGFITKKAFVEKLLMEVRVRVSEKDKKAVKDVMKELFHTSVTTEDEDSIMNQFKHYAENIVGELEKLEVHYSQCPKYPGKAILRTGKTLMQKVAQYETPLEFFTGISKDKDDYLDFAEDYEPVKAFFNGGQMTIFVRAVDMLEIYEDSKTYIVDEKLEGIVAQITAIINKPVPYADIPKLPELREQFMDAYSKLLDDNMEPVLTVISQERQRVVDVLAVKAYKDDKQQEYTSLFLEIENGAKSCNNVSKLRAYADKATALKLRLLNEMDRMDQQLAIRQAEETRKRLEEEAKRQGQPVPMPDAKPVNVPKQKTVKNVSMKSVAKTAAWRIETAEDVEKYIASLRASLMEQLEADTIVNVEM